MWFSFLKNCVLWKPLVKRIQQNLMLESSFNASIIFPYSVIYLDFFKSFDMVIYNILLSKLERNGFDGWPVWWIRHWLLSHPEGGGQWFRVLMDTPVVSLGDPYRDQCYLMPLVMTQKGLSAPSAVCWVMCLTHSYWEQIVWAISGLVYWGCGVK